MKNTKSLSRVHVTPSALSSQRVIVQSEPDQQGAGPYAYSRARGPFTPHTQGAYNFLQTKFFQLNFTAKNAYEFHINLFLFCSLSSLLSLQFLLFFSMHLFFLYFFYELQPGFFNSKFKPKIRHIRPNIATLCETLLNPPPKKNQTNHSSLNSIYEKFTNQGYFRF